MIVWQGWGIVAPFIGVGGYVLVALLVKNLMGNAYLETHSWPGALGTFLAAVALYLLGMWLSDPNKHPGRVLIDPKTGEEVVLRKKHSFFFIPLQYCGYILAVIALGILVLQHESTI